MPNHKIKIIYSLKVHIELQKQGFVYLLEMKNPNSPWLNCWVYEETPELLEAFDAILKGRGFND